MLTLLVSLSCSAEHRQDRNDLADARETWDAGGPSDYRYVYEQDSMIVLGPIDIEVEANAVTVATVEETGEPASDFYRLTVDDLLDQVDAVIDARPYTFDAEYDDLGIPTRMHTEASNHASDDVWGFTAEDFESLAED
jgi:hypothetical protein